jgi:hypothetical protein
VPLLALSQLRQGRNAHGVLVDRDEIPDVRALALSSLERAKTNLLETFLVENDAEPNWLDAFFTA